MPPGHHADSRPGATQSLPRDTIRVLVESNDLRNRDELLDFPKVRRGVARAIALAVGLEAQRAGVAPITSPEELRDRVAATQWVPEYSPLLGGCDTD